MTEPQRLDMNARHAQLGTITLADLRLLAAPASDFDSFRDDPVYVQVGDRYYPITDVATVSGPSYSYVAIQAGEGMTRYEMDKKLIAQGGR